MQLIPLNKLDESPNNVRKTPNPAFEEQLSHDIEAHGLLKNLVVTKSKKRGRYEVIDGGCRLRAMRLIVERGTWKASQEVACKLMEGSDADASEISFAANFQHLNMTPAEECRAFLHFIKDDGDTAAVAKRFGVTQRFVEGRLRLANLAEPIFAALEAGEITLDIAKAFASTDQHEVQLRVYEETRNYYGMSADGIRRMIADGSIRGTDPMARLVGEDAYIAAGGRIERDLFSDAADDRWTDIAIVHELAGAKMEAEAERLASELGLAWINPVAATGSWTARSELELYPVRLPPAPIDDAAQARIDEIEQRLAEISDRFEGIGGDEPDEEAAARLEEEYRTLEDEQYRLANPERTLPDEWKGEVGRFLVLANDGSMVLESEYWSEKPLRFETDENGDVTGGGFVERPTRSDEYVKPTAAEATGPGGKPLSARLFDELAVQRRNILAASLLRDPGLALDYAIFALADHTYQDAGTTIRGGRPQDPVSGEIPKGKAEELLAETFDALDKSWRELREPEQRFTAFRALDDDTKAEWLAYAVATSLTAKKDHSTAYNPMHALLGSILEIDPAGLWRPTSENFFDRVSKSACLAALEEVGGAELAGRYASSKKAELSASCQKLFAGETIVEPHIAERAAAWVPPAMRFDPAENGEPEPDEGEGGPVDDEADPDEVPEDPDGDTEQEPVNDEIAREEAAIEA